MRSYILRPFCCCHSKKMQTSRFTTWSVIELLYCWSSLFLTEDRYFYSSGLSGTPWLAHSPTEMTEDDHMADSTTQANPPGLSTQIMGSQSALQALGRELAPFIASALASSGTLAPGTVSVHTSPLPAPGMYQPHPPPLPYYPPSQHNWSPYGPTDRFQYDFHDRYQNGPYDRCQNGLYDRCQYGPHARFQYGPRDQFQDSCNSRLQGDSSPSQHEASTSGSQNVPDLLVSSQGSREEGDSNGDWISLISKPEERDEVLSDDSQSELDEEDKCHEIIPDEAQSFLDLAFKNQLPAPSARSGWRAFLDQLVFVLTLQQLTNQCIHLFSPHLARPKRCCHTTGSWSSCRDTLQMQQAHWHFCSQNYKQADQFQPTSCCRSYRLPCAVLGMPSHTCQSRGGSAFSSTWTSSLFWGQRNEGPDDETLFGTDFEKRAKDRVDAFKNLAGSSSVFFNSATPWGKDTQRGRGVAGKGPQRYTPTTGRERRGASQK